MSAVSRPNPARLRVKGSSRQGPRTTVRWKAECRRKTASRGRWCQGTTECSALTASNPNQCWRGLRAVIRVARQNGRGPIDLFQQHDADHLVRPSRGTERNAELCLAPQIGRKSVRAADHENSVGDRLIPPGAKMPGKSDAVDILAALVERHESGFRRDCGRNHARFLGNPGCGIAGAAFGNFMNLEAAKPEFAADVVESLAIAFGQLPLRTLLQPADRNDDKAHTAFSGKVETGLPQKMRQIDNLRACLSQNRIPCARSTLPCAQADSHRPVSQIAFAAVGPCVHNLSRL